MSDQPNLFEFAPRELSHSAFWAWVLDSLDSQEEDLRDVRDLGRELLQSVGASPPKVSIEVETEYSLPGEAGRVDIYATIDDSEALLIENKVSDRPSVDQLRAYKASPDAEEAHFLLISTTYPTQNAAKAEAEEPWTYLNAEDVLELLDEVNGDYPILTDYHRWLTDEVSQRRVLEEKALDSDPELRMEGLRTVPGQWAFMWVVTEPFAETGRQYTHRNTTSGDPWTEFRFVEEVTDDQDALYYRVEELAVGPVFRLNQYQGTVSPNLTTKNERLEVLRDLWFETVDNGGELPWDWKNTGGQKRCEIARLDLSETGAAELAEELQRVHRPYVEKVASRDWDVETVWPPEKW